MNKKQRQPQTCKTKLCCKATAQLNTEIVDELMKDDKSLSELLENQKETDDKDQENTES